MGTFRVTDIRTLEKTFVTLAAASEAKDLSRRQLRTERDTHCSRAFVLLFTDMAGLVASLKVPVLADLLDLGITSIPASSRNLAKLMMNFRSLCFVAILLLLIVPAECFRITGQSNNLFSSKLFHSAIAVPKQIRITWALDDVARVVVNFFYYDSLLLLEVFFCVRNAR